MIFQIKEVITIYFPASSCERKCAESCALARFTRTRTSDANVITFDVRFYPCRSFQRDFHATYDITAKQAAAVRQPLEHQLPIEQIRTTIEQICSIGSDYDRILQTSCQHPRRAHARTTTLYPDACRTATNRQEHCRQASAFPGRNPATRRLSEPRLFKSRLASRPMAPSTQPHHTGITVRSPRRR